MDNEKPEPYARLVWVCSECLNECEEGKDEMTCQVCNLTFESPSNGGHAKLIQEEDNE